MNFDPFNRRKIKCLEFDIAQIKAACSRLESSLHISSGRIDDRIAKLEREVKSLGESASSRSTAIEEAFKTLRMSLGLTVEERRMNADGYETEIRYVKQREDTK